MIPGYCDIEVLDRVMTADKCGGIPTNCWIVGIRSKADICDAFDDRFYLFDHKTLLATTTGTTNPGRNQLLNPTHKGGVAVLKSDMWHKNLWKPGLHRGRMEALVQNAPCQYYRDDNKNSRCEEYGRIYTGIIGLNFHTVTYVPKRKGYVLNNIGNWSAGCQVLNVTDDYFYFLEECEHQSTVTYCLLKEW